MDILCNKNKVDRDKTLISKRNYGCIYKIRYSYYCSSHCVRVSDENVVIFSIQEECRTLVHF